MSAFSPSIIGFYPVMPYVNIQITRGATREQKAALVKDVTESLVRVLGKKPEHTHVVIQEIAEDNWLADRRVEKATAEVRKLIKIA
jgi:4-oxalocrotonate tautomerase